MDHTAADSDLLGGFKLCVDLQQDAVYFMEGASAMSIAGCLDYDLDEEDIMQYILLSSPDLFQRLWLPDKMSTPLTASPSEQTLFEGYSRHPGANTPNLQIVPQVTKNISKLSHPLEMKFPCAAEQAAPNLARDSNQLKSLCLLEENTRSQTMPQDPYQEPSSGYKMFGIQEVKEVVVVRETRMEQTRQDLLLLQTKRYIQSLLLSGHCLILQKIPPGVARMRSSCCGHPLCRHYKSAIPAGKYRLSLEPTTNLNLEVAPAQKYRSSLENGLHGYMRVRSTMSRGFYCLNCFEDLFNSVGMLGGTPRTPSATPTTLPDLQKSPTSPCNPYSFDGSYNDEDVIRTNRLESTERTSPTEVRNCDFVNTGGFPSFDDKYSEPEAISRPGNDLYRPQLIVQERESHFFKRLHSSVDHQIFKAMRAPVTQPRSLPDNQLPTTTIEVLWIRLAKGQRGDMIFLFLDKIVGKPDLRELATPLVGLDLLTLKVCPSVDPSIHGEQDQERFPHLDKAAPERSLQWQMAKHLSPPTSAYCIAQHARARYTAIETFYASIAPDDCNETIQCGANLGPLGPPHSSRSSLVYFSLFAETWVGQKRYPSFDILNEKESTWEFLTLRDAAIRGLNSNESGIKERHDGVWPAFPTECFVKEPKILPLQVEKTPKFAIIPYGFLDGNDDQTSGHSQPAAHEINSSPSARLVSSPSAALTSTPRSATLTPCRRRKASASILGGSEEPITPTKRAKRTPKKTSPILLRPLSQRIETITFSDLAPFIYAETRTSPAALSKPQIAALDKWKAANSKSTLIDMISASETADETTDSPHPAPKTGSPDHSSAIPADLAALEIGGATVQPSETDDRGLGEILAEIDCRIESELDQQGKNGWEQDIPGRLAAVKIGRARGSHIDEGNGVTSPQAANRIRKRIQAAFRNEKGPFVEKK